MEVKIFKQGPYPSKDLIDFSHWDSSLSQSSYCCLREMRKEDKTYMEIKKSLNVQISAEKEEQSRGHHIS